MMKTSVSVLTLCITVFVGGWTPAQEDEEVVKWLETIKQSGIQARSIADSLPHELSDLMAMATEHNTEIRRVRAAVEMAQAEFDGALAKLTSQLRELHMRLDRQVRALENPAESVETPKDINALRRLEASAYNTNRKLRAITRTHGEIMRLLGGERGGRRNRVAGSAPMGGFAAFAQMRIPQARPAYEEGTPENLRATLGAGINIIFQDMSVVEIFGYIIDTYEINITVDLAFTPPIIRQINLKHVSLRSALLALADQMGDACFVIRDYGLFLTTRERAQTLAGPTIPEDVPYFAPVPPGQITQIQTADVAIRSIAKSMEAMMPEKAAMDLEAMSLEEAARILPLIKDRDRGRILDAMNDDRRALIIQVLQGRED